MSIEQSSEQIREEQAPSTVVAEENINKVDLMQENVGTAGEDAQKQPQKEISVPSLESVAPTIIAEQQTGQVTAANEPSITPLQEIEQAIDSKGSYFSMQDSYNRAREKAKK